MKIVFHSLRWLMLFILTGLLVYSNTIAQERTVKPLNQYVHRVWTKRDGLPHNSGRLLVQTKDGYLWIGTQNGLARFNGATFKVFDRDNTPALKHNDITALIETQDGTLWIGTYNGLVSLKDGVFTYHPTNAGREHELIRSLAADRVGNLWIGTMNAGLHKYKDGKYEFITKAQGVPSNRVNALLIDYQGNVWIGTDAGASVYRNGQWFCYNHKNGLPDDIWSLGITSDSTVWMGTTKGLVKWKNNSFRIYTTADGLSDNIIRTLYEDRSGLLWIGTERNGVCQFANGVFTPFRSSDGLSGNLVNSILEDREGIIWVGTYNAGVNQFWKGKFINYTVRDGLPNEAIMTVIQDRDGMIWIGTVEGSVLRFDGEKFSKLNATKYFLYNNIRSLFEDSRGTICIGTQNGLIQYRNGTFRTFTAEEGLLDNNIRAIGEDQKGYLWVGTLSGGVHRLENGRFINYRDKGLPMSVIRSILVDHSDAVWVGSNEALACWRKGKVTIYTQKDGLPSEPIYDMVEDSEHTIWMGSYGGGLVRMKNGKFTCFTRTQGLFSNVVYQILEDNHGYLWMSSLDGISSVSKQMLNDFADDKIDSIQCTAYTTSDGMVSGDCSGNAQSAGCKISDGRLLFATAGGIVVVDPGRIHKNLLQPPVMIERVVINKSDHSPISDNTSVPVGNGQVELHFGGLSYCVPEKVNFLYKLEGFDTEWQSVGTRHEAYYTNLSPGKYIFQVTACNNDGLWNEKGASFAFELEPRFYQTYWFYGLVFITLSGTMFGAYRLRVRQLLERKNELEQYVLERKNAEDALAEERNLLRTLIDNMPDRIYAKDLESRFIICNKALAARMGTANPDEIVGKSDFDFLPHNLAEKFRNDELIIIQSGQPLINREEPMDNSTGQTRWSLATKVPLHDNQGNIIGIVGLGRDITERKHAEEALKESEKRYRYLVEHSPNSIAIHREEEFIYVNAAAIRLFGAKDSAELIGRSFFDFIHPDYKETVHQRILKALQESKAIPLTEEKFLRLDGGIVDVEVVTLPIVLEGMPAMQVVANDITERKKLQQELVQSQKMQSIGTLAGGIAHDFNNILNIILGYTTLLYKYKSDDQKFSESITAISQTVQRAAALVRQILTFARKTDVSIEPINLIDLAHELVTMLKETFPKIIIFREEFQKDIPSIHADHTQVHQAILNLYVNARDAMPNGGTITIKVEQQLKEQVMERIPAADQDSYVCISVTDTGEGMDEATRLRVFDPFFTTKPPGKGTGMGLSVVYGAIQAHHGYVQVESELGHGTTFRLYFPAQSISKQKVDSQQPIESFEIGGTETILLVEDEEFLLDLVHLMLESKGYKVYSAKNGVEALELYESHKQEIDLVFSDMGLPGLTGIEEFRKLKELDPSVKVVFASGFFETNIKSDLLKAGVKGFIQKPYMTDEILRAVRKVLDEKRT